SRRLDDKISPKEAVILAQLRSGKCYLNIYLAKINAVASELRTCGQPEMVEHIFTECLRWTTERARLITVAGTQW
ncbi:hypothetical protein K432DRAFT_306240, partial [Lepidopterella palustris CBS 459.81]